MLSLGETGLPWVYALGVRVGFEANEVSDDAWCPHTGRPSSSIEEGFVVRAGITKMSAPGTLGSS
jgi:hypothetical protein